MCPLFTAKKGGQYVWFIRYVISFTVTCVKLCKVCQQGGFSQRQSHSYIKIYQSIFVVIRVIIENIFGGTTLNFLQAVDII